MASKRNRDDRPTMIHCEFCGEDYASTYKHCPFCDEIPMDEAGGDGEDESSHSARGGKRLVTNTRGGGYGRSPSPLRLIGIIISLAIILAAVIIVIWFIMPLVTKGSSAGDPLTLPSSQPVESVTPSTDSPAPTDSAAPVETIPADQTATDFTLSLTEFSFSNRYPDPITLTVTFIQADSTGTITWSSSDPEVVAVDDTGKVSAGSKTGSATITATMPGGVTHTCLVHNSVTTGGTSTETNTGASTGSASLSLNRTDFTLSKTYPSFQVKVSGTSSTPVWSIGNSAVATVSSNGTVTYVSKGQTTLTCSVDGQTLTCIVRCN